MAAQTHTNRKTHIVLTSHPSHIYKESPDLHWDERDPMKRGPVIASLTHPAHKNAIGTHSGSYTVYRALAMAAGQMPQDHTPDLTNTDPVEKIGPNESWWTPGK